MEIIYDKHTHEKDPLRKVSYYEDEFLLENDYLQTVKF